MCQCVTKRVFREKVDEALAEFERLRPGEGAEPIGALDDAIAYLRGQRAWIGGYPAWRDEGYLLAVGWSSGRWNWL